MKELINELEETRFDIEVIWEENRFETDIFIDTENFTVECDIIMTCSSKVMAATHYDPEEVDIYDVYYYFDNLEVWDNEEELKETNEADVYIAIQDKINPY